MTNIYSITLMDLLPENLKSDPDIQALSDAISPELQEIANSIIEVIMQYRMDDLSKDVVDLLAWQLHLDFYEPDLPLQQKRDLVKESIAWHKRKGTPWAIEQVVSVIFKQAKVLEWFDYGGQPYHFKLETEQTLSSENDLNRLVKMINVTKNQRSWLESVTIKRNLEMGRTVGGIVSKHSKTEINPIQFSLSAANNGRYYGGLNVIWNTTTIYPEVN